MAYLSQARYESECEGKVEHASERAALAAMKFWQAEGSLRGGDHLQAYQCGFCRSWHLGHDLMQARSRQGVVGKHQTNTRHA